MPSLPSTISVAEQLEYEDYVNKLELPGMPRPLSDCYESLTANESAKVGIIRTQVSIRTLSLFLHHHVDNKSNNNWLCQPSFSPISYERKLINHPNEFLTSHSTLSLEQGKVAPTFLKDYSIFPYRFDHNSPDNSEFSSIGNVYSLGIDGDSMDAYSINIPVGIGSSVLFQDAKKLFDLVSIMGKNDFSSLYEDNSSGNDCAAATSFLIGEVLRRIDQLDTKLICLILATNLSCSSLLFDTSQFGLYLNSRSMIQSQNIRFCYIAGQASMIVAANLLQISEELHSPQFWRDFWPQVHSKVNVELINFRSNVSHFLDKDWHPTLDRTMLFAATKSCTNQATTVAHSISNFIDRLNPKLQLDPKLIYSSVKDMRAFTAKLTQQIYSTLIADIFGPFGPAKAGPIPEFDIGSHTVTKGGFLKIPQKNYEGFSLNLMVSFLRRFCALKGSADECRRLFQPPDHSTDPPSQPRMFPGKEPDCVTTPSLLTLFSIAGGITDLRQNDFRKLVGWIQHGFLIVQQDLAAAVTEECFHKALPNKRQWHKSEALVGFCLAQSITQVYLKFGLLFSHTRFHQIVILPSALPIVCNSTYILPQLVDYHTTAAHLWEVVRSLFALNLLHVKLPALTTQSNDFGKLFMKDECFVASVLPLDFHPELSVRVDKFVELAKELCPDISDHSWTSVKNSLNHQLGSCDLFGLCCLLLSGSKDDNVSDDHIITDDEFWIFLAKLPREAKSKGSCLRKRGKKDTKSTFARTGAANSMGSSSRQKLPKESQSICTMSSNQEKLQSSEFPLPEQNAVVSFSPSTFQQISYTVTSPHHPPKVVVTPSTAPVSGTSSNQNKLHSPEQPFPEQSRGVSLATSTSQEIRYTVTSPTNPQKVVVVTPSTAPGSGTDLYGCTFVWYPNRKKLVLWDRDVPLPTNGIHLNPKNDRNASVKQDEQQLNNHDSCPDDPIVECSQQEDHSQQEQQQHKARQYLESLHTPISMDELDTIQSVMNLANGQGTDEIAREGNISCSRHNFRSLRPGQWLRDEVICYYLLLLKQRDEEFCKAHPERKRCHFFLSFFVTKICNEGSFQFEGRYNYQNVKSWSTNVPGA